MTELIAVLAVPTPVEPIRHWPCDCEGCLKRATHAIRFHGQAGHVHDCDFHTAELREWCDVTEAVLLPCPYMHNGQRWTDYPRELEVDNDDWEV